MMLYTAHKVQVALSMIQEREHSREVEVDEPLVSPTASEEVRFL